MTTRIHLDETGTGRAYCCRSTATQFSASLDAVTCHTCLRIYRHWQRNAEYAPDHRKPVAPAGEP